jgi:hypothetical protein
MKNTGNNNQNESIKINPKNHTDMEAANNNLNQNDMNNQNTEFSKIDFNIDFTDNVEHKPIQKQNDMNPENKKRDNLIEKDDQSVTSLQESHKRIDDSHQADLTKDWGLVEQLTNRSMYKAVQANRKELFNASAEYKIKFYRTVLDGRLEALSEKTNSGLMMIKAHYRQQVASFMMSKMDDLGKEVKSRQSEFLTMMMEKHDDVARLENYPPLKKQYVNSILAEGERYMNFLDRLVLRFENIIDEQLQKYN